MDASYILIVDDDEATCAVLGLALRTEGYFCRVAHSLKAALAILGTGDLPDLILLDLILPDANGASFLERLAANPDWSQIPVVIMSAWGKAGDVARTAQVELLAKPFSLVEAEQVVRRLTSPSG